eukprot:SAG31_NODE_6196_length_2128_cov_0.931986_2_plen_65_part_01
MLLLPSFDHLWADMAILCYVLEIPYTVSLHTRVDIYAHLFTQGAVPKFFARWVLALGYRCVLPSL